MLEKKSLVYLTAEYKKEHKITETKIFVITEVQNLGPRYVIMEYLTLQNTLVVNKEDIEEVN